MQDVRVVGLTTPSVKVCTAGGCCCPVVIYYFFFFLHKKVIGSCGFLPQCSYLSLEVFLQFKIDCVLMQPSTDAQN